MQVYLVSLLAGILFPLLPLIVEYGFTSDVKLETLTVTAIVYGPAIGLVSRHQAVAILGLFVSPVCAAIYAFSDSRVRALFPDAPFLTYGPVITGEIIYFFSFFYAWERYGRHYVNNEPFLEF
jgi:hypothetical protein